MPLALPAADDRTFASLMGDARARIPRLARGWTDHNAHDPGITILELFAWLTETDLFHAGRVSEASRRAFLRWFGLEPRGPAVARTVLTFQCATTAKTPTRIPANAAVTSAGADVVFTTRAAVHVQPARLDAVLTSGAVDLVDRSAARARGEAIAAFGPRAAEGDALYLGFDRPLAGTLQLYVWTGAPDHDDKARECLQREASGIRGERHVSCPALDWRKHYEVATVWEAYNGHDWSPVKVLADDTRALTISGFVRLSIDVSHVAGGPDKTHCFLRCRIARGRFECAPSLAAVLPNAVAANHRGRTFTRVIGTSDGRAGQVFRVEGAPLVVAHTRVRLSWADGRTWIPGDGERTWPVASSWDRVGPGDPTALLDPVAGEIRFGNGRAGRVPAAGIRIKAGSRSGGGAAGNLGAGSLSRLAKGGDQTELSISQPFAARGGAPPETLADLQGRLLDRLAHPARAVSALDIEQLALETPGVPVARVRVLPEHHSALPALPAAGCVTVVVIPACEGVRPEPTAGMLAAVRRYLGRRRPVSTELHVIGPTYTTVAVRAQLHIAPGAAGSAIAASARLRVNAFFHPLTGGADGTGWPVGRDVYRAEILALLQDTPGVQWVDALMLIAGDGEAARAFCGNVSVCPSSLIAAGAHELTSIELTRTR